MGNTPIKVGITTDRQSYSPGSVIRGKIYLAVNKKQGINASSLNLKITGEEIAIVHYTDSDDREEYGHRNVNRDVHHYEKGVDSILHLDFPLANFAGGVISTGQYEFPFEVTLPLGLPATMYSQAGESKCEIRYEISAYLQRPGGGLGASFGGSNNQCTSRVIRVLGTPRPDDSRVEGIIMPPETQGVNAMCCINRGTMTLESEVDRGILSPGDHALVSFRCKNNSTVSVTGVKVTLSEKVAWRAQHQKEQKTRVICQQFLPGEHFPELERLHRLPRHRYEYDSIEGQNMHNTSLVLPSDARESYLGSLIEVRHILTVSLNTKLCITSPESSVLVRVQAPPDVALAAPQQHAVPAPSAPPFTEDVTFIPEAEVLPPDWSAQTAELVSLPMAHALLIGESATSNGGGGELLASQTIASPSAPPVAARSMDQIESELADSYGQYEMIQRYTNDASLVHLFQNMTPDQFASLLLNIRFAGDQPRIARAIASVMDQHFTCAHVAACAMILPTAEKMDVIRSVAPLASDLGENKGIIEKELDTKERIHFKAAIK